VTSFFRDIEKVIGGIKWCDLVVEEYEGGQEKV
jgi:hypothetical protein